MVPLGCLQLAYGDKPNQQLHETPVIHNTLKPKWDWERRLVVHDMDQEVVLTCSDPGSLGILQQLALIWFHSIARAAWNKL